MLPLFLSSKSAIDQFLTAYLAEKQKELSLVNTWGSEIATRITGLVTRGKTIRGSLVFFGHEMFGADNGDDLMPVAAGLELIHTGLLVHDDIMDNDELRRGMPTIHAELGTNIGMAAGDMAFFLGYELMTQKSTPTTAHILRTISKELTSVCAAQMQDVSTSSQSEADVLSLYRYKTARYTFSLPLVLGAIVANASPATQQQLEDLGEHLGILFQISDDELNRSGDPTVSGKPRGSDERDGKKTLADVSKNIEAIVKKEKESAEEIIKTLLIKDAHKATLHDMLEFVCQRNK